MMGIEQTLPANLQEALSKGLLKRIPLTFLPFVNQQLNQWNYLFPNERQSVERLLLFVASLSPEQSTNLFHDVVELEQKMGVSHWQFSTNEQTIQNSSLLASSSYFQEWRQAVQAVFDAADAHALKNSGAAVQSERKLVLLDMPLDLPVDAATVWRRWQGIGRPIRQFAHRLCSSCDRPAQQYWWPQHRTAGYRQRPLRFLAGEYLDH